MTKFEFRYVSSLLWYKNDVTVMQCGIYDRFICFVQLNDLHFLWSQENNTDWCLDNFLLRVSFTWTNVQFNFYLLLTEMNESYYNRFICIQKLKLWKYYICSIPTLFYNILYQITSFYTQNFFRIYTYILTYLLKYAFIYNNDEICKIQI